MKYYIDDAVLYVASNRRANLTQQKYQKQIEWRRNKVKDLVIRGHSQYEISTILHISQPTISRDINNIYQHNKKRQSNSFNESYFELKNALAGLTELVKKSWTIVDDSKAGKKERIKAMSFILQCYNKRLELLNFENRFNEYKEYFDSVQKAEKEIKRREKALQAYLEGKKLTQRQIDFATDPNAVF
jgi:predicted transcriptional regulator